MNARVLLVAALIVGLAAAVAQASDRTGVYALVDRVVLEPNEQAPERVQVWGTFTLAKGGSEYTEPMRGYLYYSLVKGQEKQCRAEWADLKKVAGSGEIVSFGGRSTALGSIRPPRQRPQAVPPADAQRVAQLIGELDSEQFAAREKATRALEKLGAAAEPALRKVLDGNPSTEVRVRVQRILKEEAPDPYPLNFGLNRLPRRDNYNYEALDRLLQMPAQVSPAAGELAEPGKVTLVARKIPHARGKSARYGFELRNERTGVTEVSDAITADGGEVRWSPRTEVKAGEVYTWRVKALDGNWIGPVASVTFQGKLTQ